MMFMSQDFDLKEVTRGYQPGPITDQDIEDIKNLQPADYEIYSRKLEMICLEARDTIKKMGVSAALQAGDVCAGIYTAQGDLGGLVVPGRVALGLLVAHGRGQGLARDHLEPAGLGQGG